MGCLLLLDALGIAASMWHLIQQVADYMRNVTWAWRQTAMNHRIDLLMDALDANTPRLWVRTQKRLRMWNVLHKFRRR